MEEVPPENPAQRSTPERFDEAALVHQLSELTAAAQSLATSVAHIEERLCPSTAKQVRSGIRKMIGRVFLIGSMLLPWYIAWNYTQMRRAEMRTCLLEFMKKNADDTTTGLTNKKLVAQKLERVESTGTELALCLDQIIPKTFPELLDGISAAALRDLAGDPETIPTVLEGQ